MYIYCYTCLSSIEGEFCIEIVLLYARLSSIESIRQFRESLSS